MGDGVLPANMIGISPAIIIYFSAKVSESSPARRSVVGEAHVTNRFPFQKSRQKRLETGLAKHTF